MENRVSNIRLNFENLVLPLLVMAAVALDWSPEVKVPLIVAYWVSVLSRPAALKESVCRCVRRAARLRGRIARRWSPGRRASQDTRRTRA
jgi:hypothetical protein